jgi:hypothetical protein
MPRTKYIRPDVVYLWNLRGKIGTDAMSKQFGMFADVLNIRALEPEGNLILRLICKRVYQAKFSLWSADASFLQRLPQVKPEDDTAAELRTTSVHVAARRFQQRHSFRKFLSLLIRERGVVPLHAAPRTGKQPPRNALWYDQLAPYAKPWQAILNDKLDRLPVTRKQGSRSLSQEPEKRVARTLSLCMSRRS